MKRLFFFLITISFLISCNEDNIVPLEPEPVCQIFFSDTSFYQKIGTKETQVYRICAPDSFIHEVFVYEDIGYMAEKRKYLFLKDTMKDCLVLDLYEKQDWISGDQVRFYKDYKSKEAGKPEQVLTLGKYYSINFCGSEWTIKFKSESDPRQRFYFDVKDVARLEEGIEEGGFKTITLKKTKDGPFKSGQSVRCVFDINLPPEILVLP